MSRKDNRGRVLHKGESQRNDGRYVFRYVEKGGKTHSIYAKTLKELREKEKERTKAELTGIKYHDGNRLTLNDVFDDYIQPNEVVEGGDFDANYFQHIPYLDSFNEEKGTHLVNAGGIHYEPFGIYPGTKSDLSAVAEGDSIAVPNDTTNEARALLLLQDNGLITLKEGAGLNATVNDITDNPYNLDIVELEAAQIPRVLPEVAYAVMNGNYALEAGYSVAKDALAYESSDSEAAKTYVNVIAVKEGNENADKVKALVEALKSDAIKDYINSTYDGAVIPFE